MKIETISDEKRKIKRLDNQNDNQRDDKIFHHPFSMGIIAPKGGGKSTILINLLTRRNFYWRFFNEIHIFSPTCKMDNKWDSVLEKLEFGGCYEEFDMDILTDVLEANKARIEEYGKELSNKILVVFDDMVAHPSFRNSATLRKYLLNSRHYNTLFIYTSQKYNLLNTTIRNNLNVICFFRTENKREYKTFKEENCFINDEDFDKIYEYCTSEPYSFLCINYQEPKLKSRFNKCFENLKLE